MDFGQRERLRAARPSESWVLAQFHDTTVPGVSRCPVASLSLQLRVDRSSASAVWIAHVIEAHTEERVLISYRLRLYMGHSMSFSPKVLGAEKERFAQSGKRRASSRNAVTHIDVDARTTADTRFQ